MKLSALVAGVMGVLCGHASAATYPPTPDSWAAMFKALPIYGDGMVSCDLGGGRRAFVTGDATPRDGSAWAHSSMTVVSGQSAHVVRPDYPGTPSPYQVIPGENTNWHWLGPCAATAPTLAQPVGKLYVLAPHVAPIADWPYFKSLGHDLAVFTYTATTDPKFSKLVPIPEKAGVSWSAGLAITGGQLWAFGSSLAATDGWTGYDVFSTRTPLLTLGREWTTFTESVLSAPRDGGVETSFSVTRQADSTGRLVWKLTSRLGGAWGSGAVDEWTTPALGQPWTKREIAQVPAGAYIVWKHYGIKLANGQVPVTYNTAGNDATWMSVSP